MCPLQSAQESEAMRRELSEKVEQLKADLVVYKSLMTDVSILNFKYEEEMGLGLKKMQWAMITIGIVILKWKIKLSTEWMFLLHIEW